MDKHAYIQFPSFTIPELVHGISTRKQGSMKSGGVYQQENMTRFVHELIGSDMLLVVGKQIHSATVGFVTDATQRVIPNTDGFITEKKGVLLGIVTADCVPLLFYDKRKKIVGAAHAGYKGLLAGIISAMLEAFAAKGSDKNDMLVALGPCIGVSCYPVGKELIDAFKKLLKNDDFYQQKDDSYYLDLPVVAKQLLKKEGIIHIEETGFCTNCSLDKFYSYRGEGKETFGEFISVIGLR